MFYRIISVVTERHRVVRDACILTLSVRTEHLRECNSSAACNANQ